MGEKRIVISNALLEDLIYGRLCGPVISDAPKGMKINYVCSNVGLHGVKINTDFSVRVEHPDFEEVDKYTELPILGITFKDVADLNIQDACKKLEELAEKSPLGHEYGVMFKAIAYRLKTNEADRQHLFEDKMDLQEINENQRAVIDNITAILKHFEVEK